MRSVPDFVLTMYEGDSPQDLQDRIERLRAEKAADGHQKDDGGV